VRQRNGPAGRSTAGGERTLHGFEAELARRSAARTSSTGRVPSHRIGRPLRLILYNSRFIPAAPE